MSRLIRLIGVVLRALMLLVVVAGTPYLLLAFVQWELDPGAWPLVSRAVLALAYAAAVTFAVAVSLPDRKA